MELAEPIYWKIWMTYYDQDGNLVGRGVHTTIYKSKSTAVRRAIQLWGDNPMVKWVVSKTNPWKGEEK